MGTQAYVQAQASLASPSAMGEVDEGTGGSEQRHAAWDERPWHIISVYVKGLSIPHHLHVLGAIYPTTECRAPDFLLLFFLIAPTAAHCPAAVSFFPSPTFFRGELRPWARPP
jgi:hypothetical protein